MAKKSAKSETDTMPRPPTPVFRRPTQKAAARLTDQTSGEDKLAWLQAGYQCSPIFFGGLSSLPPLDGSSGVGNKGRNSPILRVYKPALPRFPCGEGGDSPSFIRPAGHLGPSFSKMANSPSVQTHRKPRSSSSRTAAVSASSLT